MRLPVDTLYHDLTAQGASNVTRIGDAYAPGIIAAAVYAGHKYARELGEQDNRAISFRRELTELSPAPEPRKAAE